MFEVNLINPSGIQRQGEHHVISYRDNAPSQDLPYHTEQIAVKPKLSSVNWKKIVIYSSVSLLLLISGLVVYLAEKDELAVDSYAQNALSEVQFFTILNSMCELRSIDVNLELAKYNKIRSSITFVSDHQDLLNELAQKIETRFHHSGWLGGDLTAGGRLLYQWETVSSVRPIQTVYVSKNIITGILKDLGLDWSDGGNSFTVEVPVELLDDFLEQLDSLNHTLGISFSLAPVSEQNGIQQYMIVFGYLSE